MAAATKDKTPGLLITVEGLWRCNTCARVTPTTPVCAGAHDDGSPRCGKSVCERCAKRCIRCQAPLCPGCYALSKEGTLCVQCAPPLGGRDAYLTRQKARATAPASGANGYDWRADSDRAYQAAADAQQAVEDAARREEEIERTIKEMKERMKRSSPNM